MMRPHGTFLVRRLAPFALILAAFTASLGTAAHGATSSSVVGATVPSATSLDLAGCPPTDAGRTDFGVVMPGASTVTTIDCVISFGSSNDTAQLRARQTDGRGVAMYSYGNGTLEAGYGTAGNASLTVPGYGADAFDAAMTADGKALIAGTCTVGITDSMCIARVDTTGSFDGTFGTGGVSMPAVGGDGLAWRLVTSADGGILVAGSCNGVTCVVKLDSSGSLDTSFGAGGIAATTLEHDANTPNLIEILEQPDGSVLLSGRCATPGLVGCVLRLKANGSVDGSFGTAGIALAPAAITDSFDIALQPDGQVILGGRCASDYCATRFSTSGSVDGTFGAAGVATVMAYAWMKGGGIQVLSNGDILYAATCTGFDHGCLARMDSSGTLDGAFGTAGVAIAEWEAGLSENGDGTAALLVQHDGNAVIGGACTGGWCLARFTDTGALDTTFGSGGFLAVPHLGGYEAPGELLDAGDGRMLVVSECGATTDLCGSMYLGGATFNDYSGGVSDWSTGPGHFGTCLRATASATATWTVNATCPASDGAFWNAIGTSDSTIAATTVSGTANATASLRFGLRVATNQAAGRYTAPITFTVAAP